MTIKNESSKNMVLRLLRELREEQEQDVSTYDTLAACSEEIESNWSMPSMGRTLSDGERAEWVLSVGLDFDESVHATQKRDIAVQTHTAMMSAARDTLKNTSGVLLANMTHSRPVKKFANAVIEMVDSTSKALTNRKSKSPLAIANESLMAIKSYAQSFGLESPDSHETVKAVIEVTETAIQPHVLVNRDSKARVVNVLIESHRLLGALLEDYAKTLTGVAVDSVGERHQVKLAEMLTAIHAIASWETSDTAAWAAHNVKGSTLLPLADAARVDLAQALQKLKGLAFHHQIDGAQPFLACVRFIEEALSAGSTRPILCPECQGGVLRRCKTGEEGCLHCDCCSHVGMYSVSTSPPTGEEVEEAVHKSIEVEDTERFSVVENLWTVHLMLTRALKGAGVVPLSTNPTLELLAIAIGKIEGWPIVAPRPFVKVSTESKKEAVKHLRAGSDMLEGFVDDRFTKEQQTCLDKMVIAIGRVDGWETSDAPMLKDIVVKLEDDAKSNPWVCLECGSDNVEESAWLKVNTHEVVSHGIDGPIDHFWCKNCDDVLDTDGQVKGLVRKEDYKPKEATMKVRIFLAALTRTELSKLIEVPRSTTDSELDEKVQEAWHRAGGDEFEEDPDYFEKGTCRWEKEED